jgi:hypothetical protein
MLPQGFASDRELIVGQDGDIEFGWESVVYSDLESKINFAWLQILYAQNNTWKEMFDRALKEYAGFLDVDYRLGLWDSGSPQDYEGYIDHQSSAEEGENIEMFDSYEQLLCFLFGPESHITGGNDNE